MFLGPQSVALELDVESPGEDAVQMLELTPGGFETAVNETLGDHPLGTAGEAEQAVGVSLDLAPACTSLALGPAARSLGQQPTEVAVTTLVAGEECESRQGSAGWGRVRDQAQWAWKF
jgi:hypothetical protein